MAARSWYQKLFVRTGACDSDASAAEAESQDADTQFALGVSHGNRRGVLQDFALAAQCYRKAADQNHCLAQFNLGVMCARGQGMPLDDAEAAR